MIVALWCAVGPPCSPSPHHVPLFWVVGSFVQYEGLVTDTTGIEAMKEWKYREVPVTEGLKTACGEECGWGWFLPTMMPFLSRYYTRITDDKDEFDERDPIVQVSNALAACNSNSA